MQVKSKSGRIFELPTPEENAAINAGIAADPDTYELSDAEFAQLKPFGSSQAVGKQSGGWKQKLSEATARTGT